MQKILTGLLILAGTLCASSTLPSKPYKIAQDSNPADLRIPVLNMQDFYDEELREKFVQDLYAAATTVGFFAVQNTGISCETIENAYRSSEEFFKKDDAYKMLSFDAKTAGQRGFVPGENAKGVAIKDSKQFYHIGSESSPTKNIWPADCSFQEDISLLYAELERYVIPLQEAIVAAINLRAVEKIPTSYLNETTKNGESLLRALYYPAATKEQLQDPAKPHFWGAAHTDIDYLAILPYATERGLQVEVEGQWLNVVVPPDSFIVNIGDMLQNLTNGLFTSAKHRIVALETGVERFSMVFFVHPTGNTSLSPLPSCIYQTGGKQLYAPGTRDEFLFERLLELGLAPGLLELYYATGHAERQLAYGKASPQVLEMFKEKGLPFPRVDRSCPN